MKILCAIGIHRWNYLTDFKRECTRCPEYQEWYIHADWQTEGRTSISGVELIAAERRRQVEVEGWSPEHDDIYRHGELAKAAACYAVHHTDARVVEGDEEAWPWGKEWDKRDNRDIVRQLVKAGALIAAEIDLHQRRAGR